MNPPGQPDAEKPAAQRQGGVVNRRAVLAGCAATAAVAGAGLGWWHSRPGPGDIGAALWELRFTEPGGGELSFASLRGQRLLLNFWATWCAPCVTEMPLLDRYAREQRERGWRVIGLAVDQPEPVRAFLSRQPVSFPIGLAGYEGIELSRRLGNTQGGLPFSVVFETDGTVLHRRLGTVDPEDLSRWSRTLG